MTAKQSAKFNRGLLIVVSLEFSSAEAEQTASDEDVLSISKRLLAKNHEAYEVLAK